MKTAIFLVSLFGVIAPFMGTNTWAVPTTENEFVSAYIDRPRLADGAVAPIAEPASNAPIVVTSSKAAAKKKDRIPLWELPECYRKCIDKNAHNATPAVQPTVLRYNVSTSSSESFIEPSNKLVGVDANVISPPNTDFIGDVRELSTHDFCWKMRFSVEAWMLDHLIYCVGHKCKACTPGCTKESTVWMKKYCHRDPS
ncbi:hypothetical protein F5Y17DRAFT_457677 [Xylariaceae sp. FL0594]|nr:hypothetical protein F5Y17DRAFT_457677 [Xylariaceae sp. FL0594]